MTKLRSLVGACRSKLGLTMLLAILASGLGIVWAVRFGVAADGGRGGAIGCALTFLMFFLSRPTAETAMQAPIPVADKQRADEQTADVLLEPSAKTLEAAVDQLERMKVQLARQRAAIAVMLDLAAREKIFLSIASLVSTLVWGFGDWIAKAFGAAAPAC